MQGSFLWSQQIAPFGEALGRSIGFPQSGALFSLPFPVLTCAIRPVLMAINQQYSVATGLLANGSRLASKQIQACVPSSPVAHTIWDVVLVMVKHWSSYRCQTDQGFLKAVGVQQTKLHGGCCRSLKWTAVVYV